jgi:hypothetical protein
MDQGMPAINAPKRRLGRSLTTTKARPAPVEAVALRHSPITAPGSTSSARRNTMAAAGKKPRRSGAKCWSASCTVWRGATPPFQ